MFLLLGLGCSSLLTIQIEDSATTTVQGASLLEDLIGDLGFEELVSMDITDNEELANQGVEPGDLVSVQLVAFDLEILDGDPDLSFIDTMTVSLSAPDLAEVDLAHQDDFPEGQPVVGMDLLAVEMVDYAVSQSMTLKTDVDAQRPDQDSVIEARYVLAIEATLRGAVKQAGG